MNNDMMTNIHPNARIGRGVTVSPFTTIAEHVESAMTAGSAPT